MNILGLSCFYHDSAACLVRDGQIVAAVEEERLTRRKHDNGFPTLSIASVLAQGGLTGADLDAVVFYEKPLTKLERVLQTAQAWPQESQAYLAGQLRHFTQTSLQLAVMVKESCGYEGKILYCDHHLSHAAASYYGSPFDEAAILNIDGVGEWATTTLYHAKGTTITPKRAIHYPHSLGLFYAALTAFLGFEVNEGEYKVMGLAPYGKPLHVDKLRQILKLNADGSFALDLSYFTYMHDEKCMYSDKLVALLGPARRPEAPMTQDYMDLAASVQKLIEEALLGLVRAAKETTGAKNLCLGGGVAHNIVANARLRDSKIFENLSIHFASGDSGGAIGAALYGFYALSGAPKAKACAVPYLGPSYTDAQIEEALKTRAFAYEKLDEKTLVQQVAELLEEGFVIGWHQGRMEFGPRALGNRSILASASAPDMKNVLNARVKHREEFRPFAPVVLADRAAAYFELESESPAMLFGAQVRADKRAVIPAVTHVDGSARPQTIKREDNPLYYDVIKAFADLTGVPVLVNTSFNIRGEPIVCSPTDALNCFAGTDIDFLVLGSYLVRK